LRTLKFIVDKQIIKKDPSCDFSGLVRGTKGYLEAKFSFSPEWSGCVKVVGFFSGNGVEYKPQPLDKNGCCAIPDEAVKRQSFKIKVYGKKPNYFIQTNEITIIQDGDRK
jgi:hypothetical protein